MRLGRAQDKDDPLRRFLQSLQQSIESFRSNLMRFVNDEDLISVPSRAVPNVLAQLAHFVDAAIRSRVDLDHVDTGARRDLRAAGAHPTRCCGRSLFAVQTTRDDARDGSFSCSSLPRKDVTMRNPSLVDRILQRRSNVFLAYQLGKLSRTVFPRDDLIHREREEGPLCQTPGDPRHTS